MNDSQDQDQDQDHKKSGPKTEAGLKAVEKNLPRGDAWQLSEQGEKAMKIASEMNTLKHGLYASVPIRCKASGCPYADVCPIQEMGEAPKGDKCPVEASTIEDLVERYMSEFGVEENDMVDISMIRNLVDIDISLLRCNKKLALDADVVQDVVVGLTEDGQPISQPQINKAYELQQKLLRKRHRILTLLHGTRKDKAEAEGVTIADPSEVISEMKERLNKFKEKEESVIDVSDKKEKEQPQKEGDS